MTDKIEIMAQTKISRHLRDAIRDAIKDGSYHFYSLAEFYNYAIEECIATELNIDRFGGE